MAALTCLRAAAPIPTAAVAAESRRPRHPRV